MSKAPILHDYIRFTVETFRLMFSDGKTFDIVPKTISRIQVEKPFIDSFFPIIRVDFSTDINTYFRIVKDKEKVSVQVRMDYYPFTADQERDKNIRTWFNKKFAIFLEDDLPKLQAASHALHEEITESTEAKDKDKDSYGSKNISMTVYLFLEDHLKWAYGSYSTVISSSNMTDAVGKLLEGAPCPILMTPLDNNASYKEIMLPPITRVAAIKYLESVYGLYNHGSLMFFDINDFYLLSKKTACTAWKEGEYKRIIFNIRESDDGDRFTDGSKLVPKESTVYINVNPSKISAESPSIFNNYILGNIVKSLDTTSTSPFSDFKGDTKQRGEALPKPLHNKFSNKFAAQERAYELEKQSRIMTFYLSMANHHWFHPNKEFILNFEDKNIQKEYGGKYHLQSLTITFYNSGDFFENDIVPQFSK